MFGVRGKNTREATIRRNKQRRLARNAYNPGALANLAMPRPGNKRYQMLAMQTFMARPSTRRVATRQVSRPRTIRRKPAKSWWASLFG